MYLFGYYKFENAEFMLFFFLHVKIYSFIELASVLINCINFEKCSLFVHYPHTNCNTKANVYSNLS